jgi:hypothetical protein
MILSPRLCRIVSRRAPEYAVVRGGGHFAFIAPFPAAIGGSAACDPPGFERATYQRRFNAEVCDLFSPALLPGAAP